MFSTSGEAVSQISYPTFGTSYRRYVLGALTSVYMLNLVDRGLMTLLLQPIKDDLKLSDTQLGFVTGIAFGLFYALLGLPIARWADRGNRVTITSVAIGLWAVTVMAMVFVTNYAQLVIARIMAAIGESGCKPPTYSLIGDYFPGLGERTRAMSVYYMGNFLAGVLSYVGGAWLNARYGWRATFCILGAPGLLLAILVMVTVREPRLSITRGPSPNLPPGELGGAIMTLWRQRTLRNICTALVLAWTQGLGLNPWYAAFMVRSHGMNTSELGIWFGLIFGLSGLAGTLTSGFVLGRWFASDASGQMRLIGVAVAATAPCYCAFLILPGKYQALAALIPLFFVSGFWVGPTYALMQRLVPDHRRATTMAAVMLLANLIGFGAGPQIVGILSDLFRPAMNADSLRYAMLAMSLVGFWSSYHFLCASRTIDEDVTGQQL